MKSMPGSCYDEGSNFRLKCILNDSAPQPQIVGNTTFFFRMILVLYLGHGLLSPESGFCISPKHRLGLKRACLSEHDWKA